MLKHHIPAKSGHSIKKNQNIARHVLCQLVGSIHTQESEVLSIIRYRGTSKIAGKLKKTPGVQRIFGGLA